jgi:hypothetical protein
VVKIMAGQSYSVLIDSASNNYYAGKFQLLNKDVGIGKPPAILNETFTDVMPTFGEAVLLVGSCASFYANQTVICNAQTIPTFEGCGCPSSKQYITSCDNVTASDITKYTTESYCINFLQTSPITTNSDTLPINFPVNTTIKVTNMLKTLLTEDQKKYIKCYLDNIPLNTTQVSFDEFQCEISSSVYAKKYISLYYENLDALNSKVLISSSPLEINFQRNSIIYLIKQNQFKSTLLFLMPLVLLKINILM